MRHKKSDVTQRTIREFEELDQLVARLLTPDWDRLVPRPESRDPWTVKDALVHIVYWKTHTARVAWPRRAAPQSPGLGTVARPLARGCHRLAPCGSCGRHAHACQHTRGVVWPPRARARVAARLRWPL